MARTSRASAEGGKSSTVPQADICRIGAFSNCRVLHVRGDRMTRVEEGRGEALTYPLSTISPSSITAVYREPPLSWMDFSENEFVSLDILSGLAPQYVSLEQPHIWHHEPSLAPRSGSAFPSGSPGIGGQVVRRAGLRYHPPSVTLPSM